MNKRVTEVLRQAFHNILQAGELPEVRCNFTESGRLQSYGLFEYSERWSQFAKIVSDQLVEEVGENIFTKKYNKTLLDKIAEISATVTADRIRQQGDLRFRTWMD
jgi:hypothetical protein